MNKQFRLFLFVAVLAVNIAGGLLKNQWLEYFSKPLLVILLAEYFLSRTAGISSPLKKWILFALSFSWAGDVLLMLQAKNSVFFLIGLSAFLIAHVFYIVFFHVIRVKENVRGNVWLLLAAVIYYAVLISFLSPHLGDKKLPVRVYGIVISFMFILSMHMLFIPQRRAGRWMMSGALLFVVSDSILAINKFYQTFEPAGMIIMLTYGMAQLFITEGAIQYIRIKERAK